MSVKQTGGGNATFVMHAWIAMIAMVFYLNCECLDQVGPRSAYMWPRTPGCFSSCCTAAHNGSSSYHWTQSSPTSFFVSLALFACRPAGRRYCSQRPCRFCRGSATRIHAVSPFLCGCVEKAPQLKVYHCFVNESVLWRFLVCEPCWAAVSAYKGYEGVGLQPETLADRLVLTHWAARTLLQSNRWWPQAYKRRGKLRCTARATVPNPRVQMRLTLSEETPLHNVKYSYNSKSCTCVLPQSQVCSLLAVGSILPDRQSPLRCVSHTCAWLVMQGHGIDGSPLAGVCALHRQPHCCSDPLLLARCKDDHALGAPPGEGLSSGPLMWQIGWLTGGLHAEAICQNA
eukprot:1085133-Pelagomonas_calceolata.AAC.4